MTRVPHQKRRPTTLKRSKFAKTDKGRRPETTEKATRHRAHAERSGSTERLGVEYQDGTKLVGHRRKALRMLKAIPTASLSQNLFASATTRGNLNLRKPEAGFPREASGYGTSSKRLDHSRRTDDPRRLGRLVHPARPRAPTLSFNLLLYPSHLALTTHPPLWSSTDNLAAQPHDR